MEGGGDERATNRIGERSMAVSSVVTAMGAVREPVEYVVAAAK